MSHIICPCNGIDESEVKSAVEAGARTLEEVFERLDQQIFCGGCLVDIDEWLFGARKP